MNEFHHTRVRDSRLSRDTLGKALLYRFHPVRLLPADCWAFYGLEPTMGIGPCITLQEAAQAIRSATEIPR